MEEDNTKETNVKATIDAVKGLVEAVPIYQDALQPAAKQVGQSLEVVAKTVKIALAPFKALIWGYEKIEEFISTSVSEKLKMIPKEKIVTPPPQVAGPAIEALRYAGHDENLRELYANLLASAMNKDTIEEAHPSFVEVIKNLSSDEAILLKAFIREHTYPVIDIINRKNGGNVYNVLKANFTKLDKVIKIARPDLLPTYLDNLIRLGILEIHEGRQISVPNVYDELEQDQFVENIRKMFAGSEDKIAFKRKILNLTSFGSQFIINVVMDK